MDGLGEVKLDTGSAPQGLWVRPDRFQALTGVPFSDVTHVPGRPNHPEGAEAILGLRSFPSGIGGGPVREGISSHLVLYWKACDPTEVGRRMG